MLLSMCVAVLNNSRISVIAQGSINFTRSTYKGLRMNLTQINFPPLSPICILCHKLLHSIGQFSRLRRSFAVNGNSQASRILLWELWPPPTSNHHGTRQMHRILRAYISGSQHSLKNPNHLVSTWVFWALYRFCVRQGRSVSNILLRVTFQ